MSYLSEADAKEFLADALSPRRRESFAAATRATVVDVPDSLQERLDLFFELSELAIDLETAGAKAARERARAASEASADRTARLSTTLR